MMSESTQPSAGLPSPWQDTPQDLYDEAPCGYLSFLPDGTIVNVNRTFLDWTGYERSHMVGRWRFADLLTGGGRIYHETHVAPLLRMQGEVREIALDVVCADRRRLPTLVTAVVARDGAGTPRVVRATVFNATDRRRYETELLHARRAAEESERRVRVLQRIVADLAAVPTATGVAQSMVAATRVAFTAADSALWVLDGDDLRLAAASGECPPEAPVADTGVLAEVVAGAGLRIVDDPELLGGGDRRSALLLPLTSADRVLGVLMCTFTEPPAFDDGQRDLARLLGQQAGQALDRARLYDEARQRESRAVFLAATTRALEETRQVLPRARHLVDRLAPEVAPWASVRLVGMSEPLAEVGQPPVELADAVARVVAGGVLPADSPYTVLPLAVRGAVRGTLALGVPVGEADPVFLVELADRAALALENARLYEQEREIASTLQRGLLAGDPPADERFRVETYYRAGTRGLQVGGDWYDAFLITTDKLAVVVGDVVGRGLHAASTMGQLRSAIRALAAAEAGPARLVEQLDRFVGQVDSARMATLAYAEITLSTREMVYCCAGHLPPVLMGPDGEPELLWGGRSAPLGARAGRTARSEDRLRLVDGTRLLLYTDGLIERRDRSLDAGFTALAAEFEACREAPLRGLAARLAHALAGTAQPDDVCLLCVSVGAEPRLERAIPADAHQIAPLRRDLRGWLIANAIDEDSRNAVVLACSEAVANAIEHGYRGDGRGVIVVRASLVDAGVEVRVRDEGSWRSGAGDPARGRGLLLIRQVMDEVQVEREHGTTVTMRRRTRGGAAA